jgi:hypothetical protein
MQRIAARVGRRIDESSPMLDARLGDGSRVNAIIPPLAIDGPAMSVRRFGHVTFDTQRLVEANALAESMARFLEACVGARINMLISGGTGSGKTTLLNALSRWIAGEERVVTIEDAAELQLQREHVVRLETRPPNVEGEGEAGVLITAHRHGAHDAGPGAWPLVPAAEQRDEPADLWGRSVRLRVWAGATCRWPDYRELWHHARSHGPSQRGMGQ